jgi:hypothetical protein
MSKKWSKHAEAINRSKLKVNSASCWSYYTDILQCTVNITLKKNFCEKIYFSCKHNQDDPLTPQTLKWPVLTECVAAFGRIIGVKTVWGIPFLCRVTWPSRWSQNDGSKRRKVLRRGDICHKTCSFCNTALGISYLAVAEASHVIFRRNFGTQCYEPTYSVLRSKPLDTDFRSKIT